VEILGQRFQHGAERAALNPALKAPMARLIRRIAVGQVFPRRARAQDPEDPIEHVAGIAPRAAAPIATQTGLRQEWRENRPLRVGQVHAVEYDGDRNFVHTPPAGFMR
jgi:hypothetical protein